VRNRISKIFEASSGEYPLVISISTEQLKVIKKIKARIVVAEKRKSRDKFNKTKGENHSFGAVGNLG